MENTQEPSLEGVSLTGEAGEWINWATKRIEELSQKLAGVEALLEISDRNLQNEQLRADTAKRETNGLRRELSKKEKYIEGLQTALQLRDENQIRVLKLGSAVTIDSTPYTAKVRAVLLEKGSITYNVVGWAEGRRVDDWLDQDEISLIEERPLQPVKWVKPEDISPKGLQ